MEREVHRPEGWIGELLAEVRQGLENLYGERLQGLYLYGSRARSEAEPDSDVDLLIVLDEVEYYGGELDRSAELVSELSLRYDVSISRVLLSADRWREGQGPFLMTVREDAIAA